MPEFFSAGSLWLYIIVFAFGLAVGSFANVCIYRLPRDKSVVNPPSGCPACGARIRAADNVPVLSYLLLRGRCRACGVPIPARYPVVEAANGLLYLGVLSRYGFSYSSLFFMAFSTALLIITFIDLDFQIIPDEISLPGAALAIVAGVVFLSDPFSRAEALGWKNSFIGAVTGFGLFFLVAVASRGGMGGGDVKLMAMVGGALGWKGVLLTTFMGSLLGSVIGIYLMVFKGKGRKSRIPFGPFLAAGAVISLLCGQEVLGWYLGGWR